MNSTQSPSAAVTESGVNFRPGPTTTWWTPEAVEAGELDVIVDDALSSPYCGIARTDVASTPRAIVEEMMECILVVVIVCGMWVVEVVTRCQSPGSRYFS